MKDTSPDDALRADHLDELEIPASPFAQRRVVLVIQPIWPDSARPPLFHSCNAMARRGATKTVPKIRSGLVRGAEFTEEVCPCGASRLLRDGELFGKWCHRNAARWHRDWPTREQNKREDAGGQFVKYI